MEQYILNGDFIPKNEAFISPEDRGFNFAHGIYEVIKYYGERLSGMPIIQEKFFEQTQI